MKVGDHLPMGSQRVEQIVREVARLEAGEAQSLEARHVGAQPAHERR